MTYIAGGVWTSGGSPGIDAPFLNQLDTALVALAGACPLSSINGSTSGTATMYQPQSGTIKMVVFVLNNFKNGGGSTQNMTLPVAFTTVAYLWTGDVNTFNLAHSGSNITANVVTTLASGGGTFTNISDIGSATIGQCGTFDTIKFKGGAASVHTGIIIFLGI
jgi:hypothetical protein